jgi:hypothetical protein
MGHRPSKRVVDVPSTPIPGFQVAARPADWLGDWCVAGVVWGLADQLYVEDLGSRDRAVSLGGAGRPAPVGHIRVERRRGRELDELDLERLVVGAAASRALQYPASVLGQKGQDPVLIGDEGIVRARLRPEQNT